MLFWLFVCRISHVLTLVPTWLYAIGSHLLTMDSLGTILRAKLSDCITSFRFVSISVAFHDSSAFLLLCYRILHTHGKDERCWASLSMSSLISIHNMQEAVPLYLKGPNRIYMSSPVPTIPFHKQSTQQFHYSFNRSLPLSWSPSLLSYSSPASCSSRTLWSREALSNVCQYRILRLMARFHAIKSLIALLLDNQVRYHWENHSHSPTAESEANLPEMWPAPQPADLIVQRIRISWKRMNVLV
jgi:hypothetical protein